MVKAERFRYIYTGARYGHFWTPVNMGQGAVQSLEEAPLRGVGQSPAYPINQNKINQKLENKSKNLSY